MINPHTQRMILVPSSLVRQQFTRLRKVLREEWGKRSQIDGPVAVDIHFSFLRPKGNKAPYPYRSDIDKLVRQILDILAGNRKEPGPVLRNDTLVVSLKAQKLWAETSGAEVVLHRLQADLA